MKSIMIKFLKWDSSFFNKRIGLLVLDSDYQDIGVGFGYDLIYVKSELNSVITINDFEVSFSETKVVFVKKPIQKSIIFDENISEVTDVFNKKQVYDLAFESGKWSRFKLDKKFNKDEFYSLYKTWVDNSFNKEIADAILVYKLQNDIVGFVTYKVFGEYAAIGLIAVSPDFQGKGIGRKLIKAVESELFKIQIDELRISTQLQNVSACNFYLKLGYEVLKKKMISHYWKKHE